MKKIFVLLATVLSVSALQNAEAATTSMESHSSASAAIGAATTSQDAAYNSSRVEANDYDIYYHTFYANRTAKVLVIGDGDTDLDLYIYDENGNLIEKDIDRLDTCLCEWTPRWTGRFKIKIKNLGNVYNNYTIMLE